MQVRKNPSTPLERAPLITTLRHNLVAILEIGDFRTPFVVSLFVRHCWPYVLIIPLEIGEKTFLFMCAQDGEQQAIIEGKFWAEKFQGG